jgi:hypothetical protein
MVTTMMTAHRPCNSSLSFTFSALLRRNKLYIESNDFNQFSMKRRSPLDPVSSNTLIVFLFDFQSLAGIAGRFAESARMLKN